MLTRNKLVAILCAIVGIIVLLNVWPAHAAEPIAARTMDRDVSSCDWKNGIVACFQVVDGICKMHVGYVGTIPAMFALENDKCDGWLAWRVFIQAARSNDPARKRPNRARVRGMWERWSAIRLGDMSNLTRKP